MYYPYSFFGMHALWWGFWLFSLFLLFGLATPVRRARWREYNQSTPMNVLQRRYAAGEISTADYEERKAILDRDQFQRPQTGQRPPQPLTPSPSDAR